MTKYVRALPALIVTSDTAQKTVDEIEHQETLLKTGALQKATFDSANFSSIATDAKGVIQIFNVGAERMLGYTAAEVLNQITPIDISGPQEVVTRAAALSLELGTPITPGFEALVYKASRGIEDIYELTYIRKDGSRFPAVVSVTALRDALDCIIGYLLIGTDNTARKQADDQKMKLSKDMEFIIDNIPGPVFYKDTKNHFIRVNKYLADVMGLSKLDMEGKDLLDLYPPEQARSFWEDDLEVINSGIPKLNIDEPFETASGQGWLITSKMPYFDASGKCVGIIGISLDNTAREQIEEDQNFLNQRLRDYQFYTRSLLEASIDALSACDLTGIITDVNKQMETLTGRTRDELIGAPFKNNFTDPERAEAGIKRVLVERKVSNYELIVRNFEGKETVVSFNASTFYDRNRSLLGVFVAAREMNARNASSSIDSINNRLQ
jgi:PAS domain S-box-containing protein